MVKRILSVFMAVSLLHQVIGLQPAYARSKSENKEKHAAAVKSKLQDLGLGSEIRVSSAERVNQGRVEKIADETFQLATKDGTLEMRYNKVIDLGLINPEYKARGQIDPVQVRRVVANLGAGMKAKVKLASARRIVGKIESVEKDRFTILDSQTNQSAQVRFEEVSEFGKKQLSHRTKIIIAACIGGFIAALVIVTAIKAGAH